MMIVNKIRSKCVTCKRMNADLQQQTMSQVPSHRLKPAPAFFYTYIDFFGPFQVKGVVNKRTHGKAFGIIFTCSNSRAVHCDLSQNYNMDGFLQTFRRFTSIRGYPAEVWSDCGSQLVAANKELRDMVKDFDHDKLMEFGAEKGIFPSWSPMAQRMRRIAYIIGEKSHKSCNRRTSIMLSRIANSFV